MRSAVSDRGSGFRLEHRSQIPAPDREQQWIEKYRAVVTYRKPRRVQFRRVAFAAFTAATLGLGTLFFFHVHLLK